MTQYIGTAQWGTVTDQAYTGTASTPITVSAGIFKVRLLSTTDCYVRTDSVTATTANGVYLVGLTPEYVTVRGGQTISAVQVSSGGTLQVTECM